MILYEDGLLKLDYNATTDTLYVPCPDIHAYELAYVQQAFTIVMETLRNYDIKKLLFDTSTSQLHINAEEYHRILIRLTYGLTTTRLQKLARVVSGDSVREARITQFLQDASEQMPLTYAVRNFDSKTTAQQWLSQV